ncbi:MAG: sigma-70 family RNA polymerase sigma factor [Firmicutes bacterium]|nr:sigma-70 family RNA polymerase sigma factor [Bacillota bacterium]MBR5229463.1 sigma-70 family RNA polymerase sigma factor [Bacillota bacterium]
MKTEQQKKNHIPVEEVISQHRGLLYYVIRPVVGDENLVDDCFSSIIEIIVKNYEKFDSDRGTLTAWLTKVARNGAVNFIQNKKYAMTAVVAEDASGLKEVADHKTPEDHLIEKENLAELKEALKSLDKLEAEILLRKYYYMQETRQIGAELGLSERAVEGRLYRIKKKMMKKMGGADHD